MNSKLKNQVRDWAKTHLMSYEDSHLEYYSLRLKTGVVKNNLVSNFGSDVYVSKRGRYCLNKLDRRMTGQHYSEALNYQIEMPDGEVLYPGSSKEKQENWNWRWSETKLKWGIKNGFIV